MYDVRKISSYETISGSKINLPLNNDNFMSQSVLRGKDNTNELENIIEQIKSYDLIDFITKLSALNALPENQSKSVITDPLMQSLLNLDITFFRKKPIMSYGKFKKIISSLSKLSFSHLVDPIECPFVQNLRFYKNYTVFNGINNLASERLQNLINSVVMTDNGLPKSFMEFSSRLIFTALKLSNELAQSMSYTINDSKQLASREIFVPSKLILDDISEKLIFPDNDVTNDLSIFKDYITTIDNLSKRAPISGSQFEYEYYLKPFLKVNDVIVLLNVTLLPTFLFHTIISKSKEENCQAAIIEKYNDYGYLLMQQYIKRLGYRSVLSYEYDFTLPNNNNYKENIFKVNENSVIIYYYFCFSGEYSPNKMFQNNISIVEKNDLINQQVRLLIDYLEQEGIENIYTIVVVNSVGGTFIMEQSTNSLVFNSITLDLNDLQYIAINESDNPNFLPYYILSKQAQKFAPTLFSEINLIAHYKNNKEAFYVDDNFDMKYLTLSLSGDFGINYVIQAIKKESRMVVKSPYGYYCEIILKKKTKNKSQSFIMHLPLLKRVTMLNKFSGLEIWVFTEEITEPKFANVYWDIVDIVTYWIEECSKIFESLYNTQKRITVEFKFEGDFAEYSRIHDNKIEWKETVIAKSNKDNIVFTLTPKSYTLLSCDNNRKEKEMITYILEKILAVLNIDKKNIFPYINDIFENPFKHRMCTSYVHFDGYCPVNNSERAALTSYDINILLDYIGNNMSVQDVLSKRDLKEEKNKTIIGQKVVEALYNLFQDEICRFDGENLLEYALKQMEQCRYNLYIKKNRFVQDSLCFPEHLNELNDGIDEDSSLSISISFLLEYLAATPPNGSKKISLFEFNMLISICNQIVEWAYLNDLFHYGIINDEVSLLNSGRVGFDKSNMHNLYELGKEARSNMLKKQNFSKYDQVTKELATEFLKPLDSAFEAETGCTLKSLLSVLNGIQMCINDVSQPVKKMKSNELVKLIKLNNDNITEKDIETTLDFFSLEKREDFLCPQSPYRKEDVYPWRFNRELSLIRRPLIKRDEFIIWGNNALIACKFHLIDSIMTGRYIGKSKQLKEIIGQISNRRGELFNDLVFEILCEKGFECYKNIKAINSKKIKSNSNNDLGDIDILLINRDNQSIIVIEVKDFKIARNNYELHQQNKEIFIDGKKPSYMTKHNRRVEWVMSHIDDVIAHFKLKQGKWAVKKQFIVNEMMVSAEFSNSNKNFITLNDIENL